MSRTRRTEGEVDQLSSRAAAANDSVENCVGSKLHRDWASRRHCIGTGTGED